MLPFKPQATAKAVVWKAKFVVPIGRNSGNFELFRKSIKGAFGDDANFDWIEGKDRGSRIGLLRVDIHALIILTYGVRFSTRARRTGYRTTQKSCQNLASRESQLTFRPPSDGFDFLKIGESMLEGQSPPFIGEGGVATDERSSDPAACMEAPVM